MNASGQNAIQDAPGSWGIMRYRELKSGRLVYETRSPSSFALTRPPEVTTYGEVGPSASTWLDVCPSPVPVVTVTVMVKSSCDAPTLYAWPVPPPPIRQWGLLAWVMRISHIGRPDLELRKVAAGAQQLNGSLACPAHITVLRHSTNPAHLSLRHASPANKASFLYVRPRQLTHSGFALHVKCKG